jgi:AcrR family transcriptional regulator
VSYLIERREEEKERRRLEIIEAAERLYASHGWDLLTMEQVARAARLSRALVYVYFKDKDDLLLAIAGRGMERLAERFRESAQPCQRGLEKIEAMGRAYIAFGTEFPHYFDAEMRFQAGHNLGEDRPCEAACDRAADKVRGVLVETLRLGLADGSLRADIGDPDIVSIAMWAFSHGLVRIVTSKEAGLAAHGVSVAQLTEESIGMLRYMLAARPVH